MSKCTVHGNRLKHALDENGIDRGIIYALQHKDIAYKCPGEDCGIPLIPRGEVLDKVNRRIIQPYFASEPGPSEPKGKPVPSKRGIARNLIRDTLAASLDFDHVMVTPRYVSEIKKGETWKECHDFPIDVYASRYDFDAALHIIDLEKDSSARVNYKKLKEVASEYLYKKRRFVVKEREETPLPKRIHQNVVVIKNKGSHVPAGDGQIMAKPTLWKYLTAFTDKINYYDPESGIIEPTWIWNGLPVMSHKYDTRKVYFESHEEIAQFTLSPEDPREIKEYYLDRRNRKCLHIPFWKIARFEEVAVGDDGIPQSPKRLPKQMKLF